MIINLLTSITLTGLHLAAFINSTRYAFYERFLIDRASINACDDGNGADDACDKSGARNICDTDDACGGSGIHDDNGADDTHDADGGTHDADDGNNGTCGKRGGDGTLERHVKLMLQQAKQEQTLRLLLFSCCV